MATCINDNYNDLCRICAAKTSVLVGFNIFEGEGSERDINEKISSCLPIQILKEDHLPKMVCSECVYKLELFFNFRQKSLETEAMLVDMIKKLNECTMAKVTNNSVNDGVSSGELIYEQLGEQALLALEGGAEALAYIAPAFTDHTHLTHMPDVETSQHNNSNKLPIIAIKNNLMDVKVEIVKDESNPDQTDTIIDAAESDESSADEEGEWTRNDTTVQQQYYSVQTEQSTYYVSTETDTRIAGVAAWCYCELCGSALPDKHTPHQCNAPQQSYAPQLQESIKEEGIIEQEQSHCSEEEEENDCDANESEEECSDVKEQPTKKRTEPKTCTTCGKTYKTNYRLREHMRRHTGERPYSCTTCSKQFRSKIGLAQHEATHTGRYKYTCSTCGKGFQCRSYLSVHQRVHSKDKPWPCDQCSAAFKTKQSLQDHVNRHLGVKPYACTTCGRAFITKGLWKSHQRVHEPEDANLRHPCPTCGKAFVSKSYLATHARIHTGEKPFMCEVCGKGFLTRVDLRIHATVHTGEKRYVCETCGKAFARRDALRCHSRSHTGERPFACDVCGQTFTQFSPMAIHRRLHTGERPYSCDVCNKTFVSRSIMTSHRKKHNT